MICEHCGKDKPDVQKRVNPYEQDVNNRTIIEPLCDDCAELLADEF